jgi:hypothetical protein
LGNLAQSPGVIGRPTGYLWSNSPRIIYRAVDNQIHQLWYDGNNWHHMAIGAIVGAPPTVGNPSSYSWEINASQHGIYRGVGGEIHELYRKEGVTDWTHAAIGNIANAPLAAGNPASHVWEGNNSQHHVYPGLDGKIYELWWKSGSSWRFVAIGDLANAPLAVSDPAIHMWESNSSQHRFYIGTDGQVHELWYRSN